MKNKINLTNYDYDNAVKLTYNKPNLKYPSFPNDNDLEIYEKQYNDYSYDSIHPLVAPIIENVMNVDDFVNNDNVIMTSDFNFSTPLVLEKELTINLNGKTISSGVFSENNGVITEGNTDSYPFFVQKDGELIIKGNGVVRSSDANYSMAVWAKGGKVKIYGGKFYNAGDGCDLIYASNEGDVEIYGGEFHATERSGEVPGTKNKFSALNLKDNSNSRIVVYGGKFYGFNPSDNLSEGPNTNFVADGYKSVEVEPNVWEVLEK